MLRLSNTAPFEEILQRWSAVCNTVTDLTGPRLNLPLPAPKASALPLDQLWPVFTTSVMSFLSRQGVDFFMNTIAKLYVKRWISVRLTATNFCIRKDDKYC